MSNISLSSGRTKQKQKTRAKILKTVQRLLPKGGARNLEDVAQASGISRATIYRYFSNIDTLCSEASLDVHTKSPVTLFQEVKHLTLIDRVLYIQDYFNDLALQNEAAFRTYLSLYLKEDPNNPKRSSRGSRRTASLKLALIPLQNQLDVNTYNKLIAISTTLMGIEPIITTKDVCGLQDEEAKDALKWGLEIILGAML